MAIEIVQQPVGALQGYSVVPISYTVESRYRVDAVDGGLGGWRLTEEAVSPPYVKDYDDGEEDRPAGWLSRWDVSGWGVFAALDGGERVGGAVVAWNTPGVNMLEDRDDLAVLWDLRVRPDRRRQGAGALLFRRAVEWARGKECTRLKIETQNVNVPACRFYAGRGCYLGGIHPGVYEEYPHEVQLLWYLRL